MKNSLIALAALLLSAQTLAAQAGLTVTAQAARASVKPSDPIVLRLTFRNTTAADFRLPDAVNPPAYPWWFLKLQDVNTGKMFTGVSSTPMGAAPLQGEIQPELIRAGTEKTISVAFTGFVFLEGNHEFGAARNIWFPQRTRPLTDFALSAGTYRVRVSVVFREFQNRPNNPPEIQTAIAAIQNDSVPLWKGGQAQSSEAQLIVANDATVQRSETVQIAKDMARSLIDFINIVRQDTAFVSSRVHTDLWNDLRSLEASAVAVRDNDAADIGAMNRALTVAIERCLAIRRRANEPMETQRKLQQLSFRMRQFSAPVSKP